MACAMWLRSNDSTSFIHHAFGGLGGFRNTLGEDPTMPPHGCASPSCSSVK
jgi:hypothetical protein